MILVFQHKIPCETKNQADRLFNLPLGGGGIIMKRILIEMSLVFSILLLCVLYGAVTVRDAQNTKVQKINVQNINGQNANAGSQNSSPSSGQQVSSPKKVKQQTPARAQRRPAPMAAKAAGDAFSNKISRLFLWGVGQVAGVMKGLIQGFV